MSCQIFMKDFIKIIASRKVASIEVRTRFHTEETRRLLFPHAIMRFMLSWNERYEIEQRWFPDAYPRIRGKLWAAIAEAVRPDSRILDAGSGSGSSPLRAHRGKARLIVGVDTVHAQNYRLDAFVEGDLEALPFADGMFDAIVCIDVIEHLADPGRVISEFARVLRPPSRPGGGDGGQLFFMTPSAWAPVPLMARLLPFSWHRRLKRPLGVHEEDVFPTQYRCNTPGCLDRLLRAHGLQQEWMQMVDVTFGYFAVNRLVYILGLLYSRLMYLPFLKPFRSSIVGAYRRR